MDFGGKMSPLETSRRSRLRSVGSVRWRRRSIVATMARSLSTVRTARPPGHLCGTPGAREGCETPEAGNSGARDRDCLDFTRAAFRWLSRNLLVPVQGHFASSRRDSRQGRWHRRVVARTGEPDNPFCSTTTSSKSATHDGVQRASRPVVLSSPAKTRRFPGTHPRRRRCLAPFFGVFLC